MYKVGTICKIVDGSTLDGIHVRIIDIKPNMVYDYTVEIINKDLLQDPGIQYFFHINKQYRWFTGADMYYNNYYRWVLEKI